MTIRICSALAGLALAASCLMTPVAAHAQAPASAPAIDAAPAADASAPAPAAPVATPTTAKETVDNPYGLGALWAQGDFVAKGTLIILVIMSMGSWYILITKLYESLKISGEAKQARNGFFKSASLNDAVKKLKEAAPFASSLKAAWKPANTTKAR